MGQSLKGPRLVPKSIFVASPGSKIKGALPMPVVAFIEWQKSQKIFSLLASLPGMEGVAFHSPVVKLTGV